MSRRKPFDELYREFEDAHRGSLELIRGRQSVYLPLIEQISADEPAGRRALDIGCGRGEWLGLIAEHGWHAIGVDSNASMTAIAEANGVEVISADALEYMRGCADDSFGLITAFHVVEHIEHGILTDLLNEIERVLMPGGVVILETPNPENLTVSSWSFHMDPTHKAPLPPALLHFFVRAAGMERPAIVRLNSQPLMHDGIPFNSAVSGLFTVAPDYSIIASKPAPTPDIADAIDRFAATTSEPIPNNLHALMTEIASFADAATKAEQAVRAVERLRRELRELQQTQRRWEADDAAKELSELKRLHAHVQWQLNVQAERVSRHDADLHELGALPMLKLLTRLRNIRHSLEATLKRKFGHDSRFRQKLKRLERRIRLKYLKKEHGTPSARPAVDGEPPSLSTLSWSERFAFDRLSHAVELAQATGREKLPPSKKPRLAFVSPLPPERSGVADYSAQILPELQHYYDIDVVVTQDVIDDNWIVDNCAVRSVEYFRTHADNYDRVMYHFGNSPFHMHMFDLLRTIPGVVVVHDFYLSDIIFYIEHNQNITHHWTRALLRSHGYAALKERFDRKDPTSLFPIFPTNIDVLAQSQGAIFHSEYAVSLAEKFYPAFDQSLLKVVPLARVTVAPKTKDEARRILGFSPEDIIVCSFGFIQPSKLSTRIADAWLESPLCHDRHCHLVFVGELSNDSYAEEMRARMTRADGGERIQTTGFVSAEQYALYLQAADIGVQLRAHSRGETSAAALDCLAYGLATIVNANGSMAELPTDCVRRLNDTFETAELTRALIDLRMDEGERDRLGTSAAAYVATCHAPAVAAARYHEAIEEFAATATTLHSLPALMTAARQVVPGADITAELHARAVQMGREKSQRRTHRSLFVDVSVLAMQDYGTGIQRVVRALLAELLRAPPAGFRVEPVRFSHINGQWRYVQAAEYMERTFSGEVQALHDEVIDVGEGDIFFGADFYTIGVRYGSRSGIYKEWRDRGARISFIVYDILPLTLPGCFPPDSEPAHREWMSIIAEEADDLVCISASVADEVRNWLKARPDSPAPLPSIHAWALGADIAASLPSGGLPADAESLLGTLQGKDCFLMVGTIEPRKGHWQALDAFDLLWEEGSEACLVIVGNEGWRGVPRDQARNLPEIVGRLTNHPEMGRRLFWLQGVSDEYLDRIYQEADCLIAASLDEGFGLPLIEAARHGVPILARDIPVFREVAGDSAAYFAGRDGATLATAIDLWLKDFRNGTHPKPDSMKWLSWAESAERLKGILFPAQQRP